MKFFMVSHKTFKPLWISLFLTFLYTFFSVLYIWISGNIAASFSKSVTDLQTIELIKGVMFVVITAVLFWGITFILLRSIEYEQRQRIKQRKQMMNMEQKAIVGTFASSVAHDINNILFLIEFIKEEISDLPSSDSQYQLCIENITKAVVDARNLTNKLFSLSQEGLGEFQKSEINGLIEEICDFAKGYLSQQQCLLRFEPLSPIHLEINTIIFKQALINLLINAAQANAKNIQIYLQMLPQEILIEVHDDGCGVSEELHHKIFTEFYTTKEYGTGLGLFSLTTCARIHKGKYSVCKSKLGGACFKLYLPNPVYPID